MEILADEVASLTAREQVLRAEIKRTRILLSLRRAVREGKRIGRRPSEPLDGVRVRHLLDSGFSYRKAARQMAAELGHFVSKESVIKAAARA